VRVDHQASELIWGHVAGEAPDVTWDTDLMGWMSSFTTSTGNNDLNRTDETGH
jgi:hypothetical protein